MTTHEPPKIETRQKLASLVGKRLEFNAHFVRTGSVWITNTDPDASQGTIQITTYLFRNVNVNTKNITQHVWMLSCPGLREADLVSGDIVSFDAEVIDYCKAITIGETAHTVTDYQLVDARNVQKIGRLPGWLPQEEFQRRKANGGQIGRTGTRGT